MDISVIIPVYNAEKYVRKSVESALQFDEVKEVLLIEDGSPDDSRTVCIGLSKEFSRVKLFSHPDEKNHGAGASRNLGLKNASFSFIAFLDADDYFLSNRFNTDKELFKIHTDADGIYNAIGVDYYSEEAKQVYKVPITTVNFKCYPSDLFNGLLGLKEGFGHFHLNGFTVKKNALIKMNSLFNPQLRIHQDTEFLIRASYYMNLYAGELTTPVAKRGIHSDNRITKVFNDHKKYHHTQLLLWTSLFTWSKTENLPKEKYLHIRRMFLTYKINSLKGMMKWVFLIKNSFLDRELFVNNRYYVLYNLKLFKYPVLKTGFERCRNIVLLFLKIIQKKFKRTLL